MSEAHSVEIEFRLRALELGEALDLAARVMSPRAYGLSTAFGLVFVVLSLLLIPLQIALGAPREATKSTLALVAFGCLWLLVVLPWTRYRLSALVLRVSSPSAFAPMWLDAFDEGRVFVRAKNVSAEHRLAWSRRRIESKRLFVLIRPEGAPGLIIPKRIFARQNELEAFRRTFLAPTPPLEVTQAVRTFSEDASSGALTYTLEPTEQLRGVWMLYVRSTRARIAAVALAVVLAWSVVSLHSNGMSWGGAIATYAILPVVFFVMARRRRLAVLRRNLRPVTLRVDADGIDFSGAAGVSAFAWTELEGYVEDALIVLVIVRMGFGFPLPKRVVPETTLAEVRSRLARR